MAKKALGTFPDSLKGVAMMNSVLATSQLLAPPIPNQLSRSLKTLGMLLDTNQEISISCLFICVKILLSDSS